MKIWITVLCAVTLLLGGCAKTEVPKVVVEAPDVVEAPKPAVEAPKVVTEAPKVVVDEDQLERRDGLWYFEGKPFTGVAVWKHENGKKEKEITIKDGKPDGLWTWWHENGQKKYEATWKDGKSISTKYWDRDGNPL